VGSGYRRTPPPSIGPCSLLGRSPIVKPISTVTKAARVTVFARFKQSPTETAYALLRIVAGLLFTFHGVQKLFGFHAKGQPPVGSQVWFGGIIELVCGLAIALGFYTRCAAFLASGTMAVAYVQFHWKLALDERFWPAVNQGELALVYAFLFLFMACRGGGKWALR
jgi:putative oxidoreductase